MPLLETRVDLLEFDLPFVAVLLVPPLLVVLLDDVLVDLVKRVVMMTVDNVGSRRCELKT